MTKANSFNKEFQYKTLTSKQLWLFFYLNNINELIDIINYLAGQDLYKKLDFVI